MSQHGGGPAERRQSWIAMIVADSHVFQYSNCLPHTVTAALHAHGSVTLDGEFT
ncbi:MAG: hypothetical protein GY758_23065 [Fuerstiella sp.]|nr:hypothetical protein [Fuerstiella sp.]MCP4512009.1 hypothetical protein [Fuerstiella sp.]